MGAQSLTQAEAEQRASLLAVERYDIAVDLAGLPAGPQLRSVSTVTFTCREPGAETFIECNPEVVSATLNGEPLPAAANGRISLPRLAARNTLRVEGVQADTTHSAGVHKAVDPADGEVYVWMSFEPDGAHDVWACFDQPDLKAPHAFTVTAPAAWTVTSNAGNPRVEPAGEARRWTFPDTPPLSPYNTVINAGPFYQLRRQADGYDLGLYARKSLAAVLDRDAAEIFTLTRQGLEFFGQAFGRPFPQHSYDQVFMPEFGGAMENWGCVTWTDAVLRRSEPTPAERELFALILLHEMAHMWFGNLVTMRWWDDLWLNEAFAEFACHWAAESATAYTDAWAGQLATGKLMAYLADQGPASHPIRQPIRNVAEAESIFDAITYPKGASVLKQLMAYVGEENFRAGMTAYFARHAWGNTTLQDLIDALAEASGRDLDTWRAGWLDTAGTDQLALQRDADGFVLTARGPQGPPRPQVLAIGSYRRQPALARTALTEVEVTGTQTRVDLPADADVYLLNDDDLTFATARPDAGTRKTLLETVAELPAPVSRGVAVATVWDMLMNAEATAAEAVRCLSAVLAVETSDSVIEPYLDRACSAAENWAPEADRAALTAEVAAACLALARDPGQRRVALRGLARAAADLDQVAWLQAEAGDDLDLHWRALTRKAELGGSTAAEAEALLARETDPDAWVRALTVRAAGPDAAEKEAAWQALAVDRTVPIGQVRDVGTAFWRPGQDDVLAPYTERYLGLVPGLDRGGMIPALVYTQVLFPPFAIGQDFIPRALDAAAHAAPVVRKTLTERADVIRRMLRARGR